MPTKKPFGKKQVFFSLGVILFALFLWLVLGGGVAEIMDATGPPPTDPQVRRDWLADTIKPEDPTIVVIDEKLPSWNKLNTTNTTLPARTYPKYIKATQTYGTLPNLVESLYFGDTLRDLGINTQFVHANYWYKEDKLKLWYHDYQSGMPLSQDKSKRALVHNILASRQEGFAVILFPDYHDLEDGGMERLGVTLDKLQVILESVALDIAKIAEEYNVEYLVPVNQIEAILSSNNYSAEDTLAQTNAFYARVIPKLREIYSGKLYYKMGGMRGWDHFDQISIEGADIFGFTGCYNANQHNLDFITRDIKDSATQASKMSKEYGIPWTNAEFIVSYSENFGPSSFNNEPTTPLPIENYYQVALTAFDKYGTSASGFTVHSLLSDGQVYNTPAMDLLKEFFASKP